MTSTDSQAAALICPCPPSNRLAHRNTCPAAFSTVQPRRPTPPADDVREALTEGARDSVDRIGGWKHLRKFSGMSGEWMNVLRDAIICRVADALGEVRPRGTVTDAEVNRVQEAAGERGVFMQDWEVQVILEEARKA